MSAQGKIKTLFSDKEKTEPLYPRTKMSAISNNDGVGLEAILDGTVYSDNNVIQSTVVPVNADTLGGRKASEYATNEFVIDKIAEAQLGGGSGEIDLSGYATKDELNIINNKIPTTAEQVGARPDTWLPSLSDINAAPASHLNDKNNPHGVTAEQIGAAPAGYGLGENSGRQPYTADLNEITTIGFWAMPGGNAVNYPDKISYSGYGSLLVERRTDKITQTVKFNGYIATRSSGNNGVSWDEWKYVNPPMQIGVEYPTTERSGGSLVNVKRIAYKLGAIDASGASVDSIIPHGISDFAYLVRAHCAKDSYVLPYLKSDGGFTSIASVDATNITLRAYKATWAEATWLIDLYYVKY